MDFGLTPQEQAYRKEVSDWLDKELTPELKREFRNWSWTRVPRHGITPAVRQFMRKLGQQGYLGNNWPKEYGGQGRSLMDAYIVFEEVHRHRAVFPNMVAVCFVGPTILRNGSEYLKREFLPRIAGGEIEFALGYTEPQAGSDLASLEMRAVEDGDDYVIDGQKVFNTQTHVAEYHWLAARTDPNVPKHKGVSMFVVDLKSPGITVRPLWTMAGGRTNEVFYDDVRVPKRNMVGEKNQGWYYLSTALDLERIMLTSAGELKPVLADLVQYARETTHNGHVLAEEPVVRHKLAETAIEIEIARLLCYHAVLIESRGVVPYSEASEMKVFITELGQRIANAGMQLLGLSSQLQEDSKCAAMEGKMDVAYRATVMPTFGGGSSELMRNIIALRGLGLPAQ